MYLSEHDLNLLKYLFKVKVATYTQIHRDVYPMYAKKTTYKRVVAMQKNRLLSSSYNRVGLPKEKVLSLSKLGYTKFVEIGGESRVELKSDAVAHDLVLADIRHQFLNCDKIKEYYTENQIQTWWSRSSDYLHRGLASLNTDALALTSIGDELVWSAVEHEPSEKSDARYRSILKRFYSNQDLTFVLYCCSNEKIKNKLIEAEQKIYKDSFPKLFFNVGEFLNIHDTLIFSNRDKKKLSLQLKSAQESLEN
ncbi:MAG: hypothetical protein HRU09_13070 [Oligoflexales bacterium]|nr:hypothetical protein [Oligoflexales bacterium]